MKILGLEIFPSKVNQVVQPQILTKKPGFSVTAFTSNNPFVNLIDPEVNYFDQYILYTYKAIDYISNKIASAPICLYDKKDTKTRIEKNDQDIYRDLESFNPYMSLWEARKLVQMHLFLTGAAYWYIDREPEQNKIAEFYPLEPTKIKLKTNDAGLPAYYSYYDANGHVVNLPLEDVIYFRRINPKNWFEGLSHTKTTAFWLNAYAQGAQYNMNKLGNNTNVDKFIYFEGIGDDERDKVEEKLRNKYGGVKNAGRTGVVSVKPEVIDVSTNQKDLDYVNGMKMLREDILVSFGIPEALFFPSATNANSKEATKLFQADTLEPLLQQEKAVLNEQLLKKYNLKLGAKNTFYFDFEQIVDEDRGQLVTEAKDLFSSGIYTRDQALEYIGDEAIGGEDGAAYAIGNTNTDTNPTMSEPTMTEPMMSDKSMKLLERVENMIKENNKIKWRQKNIKLAEDQEGIMFEAAINLFEEQLRNAIQYINKTDTPTIRGVFNLKENIQLTKETFKNAYSKVMGNSNDVGNVEIKHALFEKGSSNFVNYHVKSISMEAIEEIARKLSYFSEEISEVTRNKLREIIVEGINNGFDKTIFIDSIHNLFNGFADGQGNIDILSKNGFYVEAFKLDGTSVIKTDPHRYKQMFGKIIDSWSKNEITLTQRDDALKALRGLIDPSSATGKDIDSLLNNMGTSKKAGISQSRAVTIARTEATFARNLGFQDVYKDNPFVNKKTWNSLHDNDVRDSHQKLDGKTVEINKAFEGSSGKLMFPGDTSLGANASEIVNCRCRITAEVS